jgi:hypothetical protein
MTKTIRALRGAPSQTAREQFEAGNLAASRLILSDVAKYGDESAGLVVWARTFMRKHLERSGQLRLRGHDEHE